MATAAASDPGSTGLTLLEILQRDPPAAEAPQEVETKALSGSVGP